MWRSPVSAVLLASAVSVAVGQSSSAESPTTEAAPVASSGLPMNRIFFNVSLPTSSAFVGFLPDSQSTFTTNRLWTEVWSDLNPRISPEGYGNGTVGVGTPMRYSNAVLRDMLTFQGDPAILIATPMTDLWIYGRVNGTTTTAVQGRPIALAMDAQTLAFYAPDAEKNVLLAVEGQEFASHRAFVSTHGFTGRLEVDRVEFRTGMLTQAPSFDDVSKHQEPFITSNYTINPFYNTLGTVWNISTHIGGVDGQNMISHATIVGDRYSEVIISIPANTSYFVLEGTAGPDYGIVAFDWIDNNSPEGSAENSLVYVYNLLTTPTTMYLAPLDPTRLYRVKVTMDKDHEANDYARANNPNDTFVGEHFSLHSATFYSALWDEPLAADNSTDADNAADVVASTSSKVSRGTIAGAVVGSVIGALLIAGIVAWFWRRRRHKDKRSPKDGDTFEVDGEAPLRTPYVLPNVSEIMRNQKATVTSSGSSGSTPSPASQPSPLVHHDDTLSPAGGSNFEYAAASVARTPSAAGPSSLEHAVAGAATRTPRQAVDGGALEALTDDDAETIPPEYDPRWAQSRRVRNANASPHSVASHSNGLRSPPRDMSRSLPTPPGGRSETPLSPLEREVKGAFGTSR